MVSKFAYALWFAVEADRSVVVACLHQHMSRKRLKGRDRAP
jgi:hypothetical protein